MSHIATNHTTTTIPVPQRGVCPGCGRCRECGQPSPRPPIRPYVPPGVQPYEPLGPHREGGPIWISQPGVPSATFNF